MENGHCSSFRFGRSKTVTGKDNQFLSTLKEVHHPAAHLTGAWAAIITLITIAMSLFHLYYNSYGHLMSFRFAGGPEPTRKMFDAMQRIWRATDLGRIKSVATIPAISTHQQQGEEGRALADVPPNMVRLCVGAEHPDDIIADLDQALNAVK